MHICMVNPPSPFLLNDRGAPPLGILHLAAECMERGIECSFWDMTGDPELAKQLSRHEPDSGSVPRAILSSVVGAYAEQDTPVDLFAITATSAQYESSRRLMQMIHEDFQKIPVVIGGSHVSTLPDMAIDDGFDWVVTGEADLDFPNWLAKWGVPKRHENPLIMRCTAPSNVDSLQFPARQLVDLKSYCSNLAVGEGLSTTVHASRGCPFTCAYCVRELGDKARIYRQRSAESVLAELDSIRDEYDISRFVFTDDIFGLKKPWLKEFCEMLEGRNYEFRCNIRANTLYRDLLPNMARAGFKVISFGFESADERVLSSISKNSVELNARAIKACHDAGIYVKSYFIWGFKDDDERSAEALRDFIIQHQPDTFQIATLIPLPGTPLYREAITGGWLPDYTQLYHNGVDGRGGMLRLPWQTDRTFELRDELVAYSQEYNRIAAVTTPPWCTSKLSEPWE